jgi:hypothetical protein
LSCFSSTVNLKRKDEQVQFASQGCPGERIQPLANRHRLVYKIRTSNLDLEPALGGILADYTQFARLAVGTNIVSRPTSNGSAWANVSLKPAPLLLHSGAHSRRKQWEDRQPSCFTRSRW